MARLSALLPGYTLGTYSCLMLSRTDSRIATGRIKSVNTPNDPIKNRTCNLPACSAVPQPTAPPSIFRHWIKWANMCVCVYICHLIISHFFVGNLLFISLCLHRKRPALWCWKVEATRQCQQVAETRSGILQWVLRTVSSNLAELQEHGWDWGGNKSDDRQNVGFIDTKHLREWMVFFSR
jgi:hypothetical protein